MFCGCKLPMDLLRLSILLPVFLIRFAGASTRTCATRQFGDVTSDKIVCVCNATYCDDFPAIGQLTELMAIVYTTSKSGKRFQRKVHQFDEPSNDSIAHRIKLDANERMQTIIGFGGAFTDATGINLNALSESARNNVLDSYFGQNGLEYTLGRVPIASTDFSTHEYSYDATPGDFNLSNFALADEDLTLKIPYIKQASKLTDGQLKLFASPWSAPGWMKTTGRMVGGGSLREDPDGLYHSTWADYYVRFLEAYQKHGLYFWGLTVQNEPSTGADLQYKWQTMYFNPKTERDFIKKYLGPRLKSSELGRNISLIIMDDQRMQLPIWADVVLKDKEAAEYIAGIGVHWYTDWVPASLLSTTHNRHPEKFILATEACNGFRPLEHKPILGDWLRGEKYAYDIIEDLSNWVSGWMDWNLCLDLRGGPNFVENFVDSPVIVNATADEFYKQPMFYVLGHFSKFLRPGSIQIELQFPEAPNDYSGVAFITPDKRKVLILQNRAEQSVQFSVEDKAIPDKALQLTVEPRSILSAIWL